MTEQTSETRTIVLRATQRHKTPEAELRVGGVLLARAAARHQVILEDGVRLFFAGDALVSAGSRARPVCIVTEGAVLAATLPRDDADALLRDAEGWEAAPLDAPTPAEREAEARITAGRLARDLQDRLDETADAAA